MIDYLFYPCMYLFNILFKILEYNILFINLIYSKKHIPSQILFNGVVMSDKDWNDFYTKIATPEIVDSIGKISNLKMLSWCYNKMNGKQVEMFIQFLSKK